MAGFQTYLCYKDNNGFRGYIPPHTPYIIRQISEAFYWLEADGVTALINVGLIPADPDEDPECNRYQTVIGFVSKETSALKWVMCEDSSQFIGTNNCISKD